MALGATYDYTGASAKIAVSVGARVISVRVEGWELWEGQFIGPASATRLQPGRYELGPENGTSPSAFWAQISPPVAKAVRMCKPTGTGWFEIESITYSGETPTSLSLRFEFLCPGSTAPVRGLVQWRADDATPIAGPSPIPPGLWQPATGATPATGNYIYLESEPGDVVGGGLTRILTPPDSTFSFNLGYLDRAISVSVNENSTAWSGRFQVMSSVSFPQVGYYPDMRGTSAIWGLNHVMGGMFWHGPNRCSSQGTPPIGLEAPYRGWFAIDSVSIVGGEVKSLDLRFEQRCEGQLPALRGKVHWVKG
ncbi:MAG: hypothetical protein V4669_15885 [Pseudomonadota bacterium]